MKGCTTVKCVSESTTNLAKCWLSGAIDVEAALIAKESDLLGKPFAADTGQREAIDTFVTKLQPLRVDLFQGTLQQFNEQASRGPAGR